MKLKYDLIGKRFGKLVVIGRSEKDKNGRRNWLCQCDCGKQKIAESYKLLHNQVRTCGCFNGIDLIGKKFNKLTVIKLNSKTNKLKHDRYWLCKCDCQTIKSVRQYHLIHGLIKSCGCDHDMIGKKHPSWNGIGEISGSYLNGIKHGAKIRGLKFNINKKYLWELFLKQNRKCSLTDLELKFSSRTYSIEGTASLDRIDNSKDYIKGNVQWIHKDINKMKMDLSEEKLLKYCKLICLKKGIM